MNTLKEYMIYAVSIWMVISIFGFISKIYLEL